MCHNLSKHSHQFETTYAISREGKEGKMLGLVVVVVLETVMFISVAAVRII